MERQVINEFSGANRFLSNFHLCKLIYDGVEYRHTEGAFQAQKTLNRDERKYIATLSAGNAKKACGRRGLGGFHIELRPDWEEVKDQLMYEILVAKFTQNADLRAKLLVTGDAELIEGNTWDDNYWGNCTCDKCVNIPGRNQLGKTLMRVRDEIQKGMI